jgi:hypothetical protein
MLQTVPVTNDLETSAMEMNSKWDRVFRAALAAEGYSYPETIEVNSNMVDVNGQLQMKSMTVRVTF